MRICYLSTGPFGHVGAYLDFFKDAGHDVHFIALSPSPPRRVPVHDLALGGRYSGTEGKWKYPLSMLRARALVRRLAPDVLHAHYATSGGLAALACGFRPTVVTAHGTDLRVGARSALWRPLLRAVFERADCVNTVSDGLKELAVGLGVDAERIVVLSPGVDTARFRGPLQPGPKGGPLRLLCTRQLESVYDPAAIVEALAIARRRGLRFTMTFAGDGSLRPAVEALVRRRGLAGMVSLLGAVGHDAVPGLLRRHDVYLSSSRADGTSLSLLEAMATGLFPIVSRIPANAAWLEDGAGGFLHAAGDPADLARRILEFSRRPSAAEAAARLNRQRVLARGDRRVNMRRLERIYRELAARRRAGGGVSCPSA